MSLFNNARNVSRERIIGISLVDILIQIVFVLFIALIAGYEDPEIRLRLIVDNTYAGKELCDTGFSGKDSTTKCVSVEDYKKLKEAKLKEKKLKEVNGKADTENGKLVACMPQSDGKSTHPAFKYTVAKRDSPEIDEAKIYFHGFTKDYLNYLNEHKMERSRKLADAIKEGFISVSELEKNFGFIREADCYHEAQSTHNDVEDSQMLANPVKGRVNQVIKDFTRLRKKI